jgi:hypothetical protein
MSLRLKAETMRPTQVRHLPPPLNIAASFVEAAYIFHSFTSSRHGGGA